jgi:hypothetical protein
VDHLLSYEQHWSQPSKFEWIEEGLKDLKRIISEKNIPSVALPLRGSGNDGLDGRDVRPKIEAALGSLYDVKVVVYEPPRPPAPSPAAGSARA